MKNNLLFYVLKNVLSESKNRAKTRSKLGDVLLKGQGCGIPDAPVVKILQNNFSIFRELRIFRTVIILFYENEMRCVISFENFLLLKKSTRLHWSIFYDVIYK